MWRIAVCDDEDYMLEKLSGYLDRVAAESGVSFETILCRSAEELLPIADTADIILLDIAMNGISGMDAARILRKHNQNVCIIFITSMIDYALEGYSVHAFGFLKKPVQYGTFLQQMEDAISSLTKSEGVILSLRNGTEIARISSNDIYYIEVLGHYVSIHTASETRQYPASISSLENQLKDAGFFRCHKSFLIHFRYVARILPSSVLTADGSDIPISKHRRKELLTAFAVYEGRQL